MKAIFKIVFLVALGISNIAFSLETNHPVDVVKSHISWVGKKVTGQHDGYLSLKEGSVMIENGLILSGKFILDMNSITNKDLADDPKYKAKLENHLKADDFFNVTMFPEAVFVLTKAVHQGNGKYTFTGDLKVKEFTHPVSFDGVVKKEGDVYHAQASVVIDRSKWGIKFNSKSFFDVNKLGDKLIYDDIEIGLDLYTK